MMHLRIGQSKTKKIPDRHLLSTSMRIIAVRKAEEKKNAHAAHGRIQKEKM